MVRRGGRAAPGSGDPTGKKTRRCSGDGVAPAKQWRDEAATVWGGGIRDDVVGVVCPDLEIAGEWGSERERVGVGVVGERG